MKLTVNIHPVTLTVNSKSEALNKVQGFGIVTFSADGNYLTAYDDRKNKFAVVVNYQKVNRKTRQVKNVNTGKTKSTVLRKKHWIVRRYDISIDLLRLAGLKVIQMPRYFKIESRG